VKPKLSLAVRTYRCEQCDLVIDRDVNAAANLAARGEQRRGTPPQG
jgi:putative transposase